MKIINIEKLNGYRTIVLTGRNENVRAIAKYLKAILYYVPRDTDYFEDYPMVANELKETVDNMQYIDRVVAITSQSEEFLDCLLQSELDFVLVTVRKDAKEEDLYRLRVITKKDAWANRCAFHFELRR